MAYCTLKNVEAKTGLTYNGESQPTNTEVLTIVTDVAAEIDGVLRAAGYSVPATGANDKALLRHYNTLGAAYQAWHAGISGTDKFPRVEAWERDYRDFLSRIRRGEQTLIDQVPDGGAPSTLASIELDRTDGYAEEADDSEYGATTVYVRVR